MPDRYSQKACLPFQIFPRNVEHVRSDFARNQLQPLQLVFADVGRFAIDPGTMRHDCFAVWLDGLNRFELDVSFGRPSAAEGLYRSLGYVVVGVRDVYGQPMAALWWSANLGTWVPQGWWTGSTSNGVPSALLAVTAGPAGFAAVGAVAFMVLDGVWLGLLMKNFYREQLAPIVRLGDGRMVVNPGSVGLPGYTGTKPVPYRVETGTPDACYAILRKTPHGWAAALRYVPYDGSAMALLARQKGLHDWASAIECGWIR